MPVLGLHMPNKEVSVPAGGTKGLQCVLAVDIAFVVCWPWQFWLQVFASLSDQHIAVSKWCLHLQSIPQQDSLTGFNPAHTQRLRTYLAAQRPNELEALSNQLRGHSLDTSTANLQRQLAAGAAFTVRTLNHLASTVCSCSEELTQMFLLFKLGYVFCPCELSFSPAFMSTFFKWIYHGSCTCVVRGLS